MNGSKKKKFWNFSSIFYIEIASCILLLILSIIKGGTWFYIISPLVIVAIIFTIYRMLNLHKDITIFLKNMSEHLDINNLNNIFDLPMPVFVISDKNEISWYNDNFKENVLNGEDIYGMDISVITSTAIERLRDYPGHIISYNDKFYKIYTVNSQDVAGGYYMFYMIEITSLKKTYDLYFKTRPVVMMIFIDSYDEIVKNIKESERTKILSDMNRLFEENIGKTKGMIERLERDKYFVIMERQYFDKMKEEKFPILDEAKNIITSERVPVTLSIGVSYQAETFEKNELYARQSLEMSLGRGGDQVAIKTETGFEFYGGISKGIEKRAKVKSRILASAMRELIEDSENILIMGHRFADLDAMGSAIGFARACTCLEKPVNIVVDQSRCLANSLIDYYKKFEDNGLFVNPKDALDLITKNTTLFIVDTHSPSYVESEDVYRECEKIVVIDHHRKMVNYIDNAVIFYHEPFTSSTSEMVTELVQYMGENCKLEHYHAEALLSGLMLDTKNFVMKTGVRTFEAAAFLKKCGADTITVKKLFAGPMQDYINKSKLVSSAEIYKKCAIVSTNMNNNSMRVIAPQTADELLNISDVDASFVIFDQNGTINVNARSMGNLNVQVIMEELGGGGHQTMAGAQIPNAKVDGVKRLLKKSIDEYYEK